MKEKNPLYFIVIAILVKTDKDSTRIVLAFPFKTQKAISFPVA